jgi:hypothetical protein
VAATITTSNLQTPAVAATTTTANLQTPAANPVAATTTTANLQTPAANPVAATTTTANPVAATTTTANPVAATTATANPVAATTTTANPVTATTTTANLQTPAAATTTTVQQSNDAAVATPTSSINQQSTNDGQTPRVHPVAATSTTSINQQSTSDGQTSTVQQVDADGVVINDDADADGVVINDDADRQKPVEDPVAADRHQTPAPEQQNHEAPPTVSRPKPAPISTVLKHRIEGNDVFNAKRAKVSDRIITLLSEFVREVKTDEEPHINFEHSVKRSAEEKKKIEHEINTRYPSSLKLCVRRALYYDSQPKDGFALAIATATVKTACERSLDLLVNDSAKLSLFEAMQQAEMKSQPGRHDQDPYYNLGRMTVSALRSQKAGYFVYAKVLYFVDEWMHTTIMADLGLPRNNQEVLQKKKQLYEDYQLFTMGIDKLDEYKSIVSDGCRVFGAVEHILKVSGNQRKMVNRLFEFLSNLPRSTYEKGTNKAMWGLVIECWCNDNQLPHQDYSEADPFGDALRDDMEDRLRTVFSKTQIEE